MRMGKKGYTKSKKKLTVRSPSFFTMLANVGKNGHQNTEHARNVAAHSPYFRGPLFIATSSGPLYVVLMHSPALSSKPMDSSYAK